MLPRFDVTRVIRMTVQRADVWSCDLLHKNHGREWREKRRDAAHVGRGSEYAWDSEGSKRRRLPSHCTVANASRTLVWNKEEFCWPCNRIRSIRERLSSVLALEPTPMRFLATYSMSLRLSWRSFLTRWILSVLRQRICQDGSSQRHVKSKVGICECCCLLRLCHI